VTHAHGALLVLDEVISLRMATGGMQALLGVDPDLTMMGKIIGGGFPVGAIGGKAEYMAVMDPRAPRLFHSGTFNGNPVTTSAGIVSVTELTEARIDTMAALAETLEARLRVSAHRLGLPFSSRRVGSLVNVYFLDTPPVANLVRADAGQMAMFHLAGMNHGCYFPSRGLLVLSTVMDEAAIEDIALRLGDAMADVAAAL
jgi:glutamate-1-semialdehyde 2,1-aminomutase